MQGCEKISVVASQGCHTPCKAVRKLAWSPLYPTQQGSQQGALDICNEVPRQQWADFDFSAKTYWDAVCSGNEMFLYVILERLGDGGVWGNGVEHFKWNDLWVAP